ncbi:MAG: hypothetical protein ACO1NZ_16230 [Adhaeribacter sp.]
MLLEAVAAAIFVAAGISGNLFYLHEIKEVHEKKEIKITTSLPVIKSAMWISE